ncbi:hypothetical protein ABBQ38_007249 [Trebouxia sp. C0009 RCD-2024]
MVLRHSPGSVLPTFARPFCRVHYTSVISSCAVHVPLSPRPLSPQQAKSLITRDRLLSSVAARTSTPQVSTSSSSREVVELAILIDVLPARVRAALQPHKALSQLVEVVLDLGRPVVARFTEGAQLLSRDPLTQAELEEVTSKVGEFGGDNRAGINRCLHRISCIRNRDGHIVGLTCRVGRAITGSANMAADVVLSGKSILLLGRPGVGKTTAIRDISSMLAEAAHKRVVIIDTSNEIAGDGDVPHPGIATARRMQVPVPEQQHRVMIEAVENHMPEVIVIDEIGSEAEALAAATIAQRGVQLVATAHGERLENILNNPTLQSLLGGVESVTLGDEQAKKRGVQKSVRERAGPPTFECCIEMEDRLHWNIYEDVASATDALLAGKEVQPMLCYRDADGSVFSETRNVFGRSETTSVLTARPSASPQSEPSSATQLEPDPSSGSSSSSSASASESDSEDKEEEEVVSHLQRLQGLAGSWRRVNKRPRLGKDGREHRGTGLGAGQLEGGGEGEPEVAAMQVYVHGIHEAVLQSVLTPSPLWHRIQLNKNLESCDAVLALRGKIKAGGWLRTAAKAYAVPIFSVKTGSPEHLTRAVQTILGIQPSPSGMFGAPRGPDATSVAAPPAALTADWDQETEEGASASKAVDDASEVSPSWRYQDARDEALIAVEQVVIPRQQPIELLPQTPELLDMQVDIIKKFDLRYEVVGEDANSRLRIMPSSL